MTEQTDKYALFSKAFAELSEELQDKLVDMANLLLEAHRLAEGGEAEDARTRKVRADAVGSNE